MDVLVQVSLVQDMARIILWILFAVLVSIAAFCEYAYGADYESNGIVLAIVVGGWDLIIDNEPYFMRWFGDRLLTYGRDVCYWVYENEIGLVIEDC